MKQELLKGLTDEQIAKIKACKNQEELFALAKAEGIELSDEQLEAVSGGWCSETTEPCPNVVLLVLKKNTVETMSICALSSFAKNVVTNGIQINLKMDKI